MPSKISHIWPLPQPFVRITSPYGGRINPITGQPQKHRGIDIAADTMTPIFATAGGKVSRAALEKDAKSDGGRAAGNYIELTHEDGSVSRYLHQTKFNVKQGDTVKKGDIIGYIGSSGASTGPHLHYEIWTGAPFASQERNPTDVLTGSGRAVAETFVRKNWRWIAVAGLAGAAAALAVTYQPAPAAPRPVMANPRLRIRA
jgi:murein DD-endopeptidase MepM/ murein hydrolase activator NlpD